MVNLAILRLLRSRFADKSAPTRIEIPFAARQRGISYGPAARGWDNVGNAFRWELTGTRSFVCE